MLPPPSTSGTPSSSIFSSVPSFSLIVRRIQNHRQLAAIFLTLLCFISYHSGLLSTKQPVYLEKGPDSPIIDEYSPEYKFPSLTQKSQNPSGKSKNIPGKPPSRAMRDKQIEEFLAAQNSYMHAKGTKIDKNNPSGRQSCPDYTLYSSAIHHPLSTGPLQLPFQRPSKECRTFISDSVERVISDMNSRISDPDLARLFENCFPNTLDTTVLWHHPEADPQTFIVTGDIHALWLRDAHKQVQIYSPLSKHDPKIRDLILGVINTESDYVLSNPYCNAFQPPAQSGISFNYNNEKDIVYPRVNLNIVFECKYEIDSLASFLALGNEYYKETGDSSFVTPSWLNALSRLLRVLQEQTIPTYSETGHKLPNYYTFRRTTDIGTETLNLAGSGNPVNGNTSLIRSAFRPSDDATIYQFFIPGNAFMSVELKRTAKLLESLHHNELAKQVLGLGEDIERGIYEHGVYDHPVYGKVFAYEVDGFGSVSIMDDANTPSLLSLPDMGFVSSDYEIYVNTRKMILSKNGNPYYLKGKFFEGIGGPHIGTRFAWPMSHIIAMRTTDNDTEIAYSLDLIKKSTAGLGLMHESVNVDLPHSFTRSWFAWCNAEFAKTILHLAEQKPHLIFNSGLPSYNIRDIISSTVENSDQNHN